MWEYNYGSCYVGLGAGIADPSDLEYVICLVSMIPTRELTDCIECVPGCSLTTSILWSLIAVLSVFLHARRGRATMLTLLPPRDDALRMPQPKAAPRCGIS